MREWEGVIRRRRSLHWPMGQYLSLRAVLNEPFLRDHWGAAIVSTQVDLVEAQGVAAVWPHPTLAELYMILLAYDPKAVPIEHNKIKKKTESHIEQLLAIAGYDSFAVYSTIRQFQRYINWWGTKEFETLLENEDRKRERSWTASGGLVALAKKLVKELER